MILGIAAGAADLIPSTPTVKTRNTGGSTGNRTQGAGLVDGFVPYNISFP